MGLKTDATCKLAHGNAQVQWYRDHDAATSALQMGQAMGGTGWSLVGDQWLVTGTKADLIKAQAKVGGDLQQLG